jgi:hypothetical protein
MLNRHLMVLKNVRPVQALARLPALLWADLVDGGYVLCVRPRLLTYAPRAVALMWKAVGKRRMS